MCGIAAIFFHRPNHARWARKTVDSMLDRIGHRGFRTLAGSRIVGRSAMGCVRLPIRDPIAGIQPSFNADMSVAALLNGEIYNVDELRHDDDIETNSDTALLPYIYRESSSDETHEDRLLKCRGIFALILHDVHSDPPTAKILRDHIGVKPLYLANSTKGILLASELKAFLDEQTTSVREIRPGELLTLTLRNGKWFESESKDVRNQLLAGPHSADKTAKSLRKTISEVVRSQWPVEDLPVAVLCSGGIDSSIVTYELEQHRSKSQPVVAYTARCVDDQSASASSDIIAAERLCAALKIPLQEIRMTYDDLFNVLADAIYHVESFEPNIVRNSALQYQIIRQIAADGFRVAFCGEGADELFWGYADFASSNNPDELSEKLLRDLHRTQLQRVDRMGMAHAVEVRVPFLDESVVRFAAGLPAEEKYLRSCGMWLGKKLLREAYSNTDKFPDEIVLRRKATMAFGAGFGGVEMNDEPMNSRACHLLAARGVDRKSVMKSFPNAFPGGIATDERALYVHIYASLGFQIPTPYDLPCVAEVEKAQ